MEPGGQRFSAHAEQIGDANLVLTGITKTYEVLKTS